MSKALIEEVKDRLMVAETDEEARNIVGAVLDGIVAVTGRGEKVIVRGFGTFERKRRAQRKARNPRTGEVITVAERTKLTFADRTER